MTGFKRLLRLPGGERAEVDDEIGYHIEMKTEQLMQKGWSEASARQEAVRQFGDRERIRGEVAGLAEDRGRSERRASLIDAARQDVGFAFRQLRTSPVFTLVALLTIGLGIGATTAIFSVVRAVLLRPLPYAGAEQIVVIGESDDRHEQNAQTTTSYPNFEEWKARARGLEAIAVFDGWSPTLTGLGEPQRIGGSIVTSEFFDAFRLVPAAGRRMLPTDNVPNGPLIVWISWAFWQSRFGGDAAVVGKALTLNGTAREIVGVMPRDFKSPGVEMGNDVWIPNYKDENDTRGSRYLNVVGRLKPGVALAQARSEFDGITEQLQREFPESNKGVYAVVFPLRDLVVGGRTRGPVLLLMLASVLVLLIACANTSNLLIARGSYRAKEFAIRAALGTTGGRIVRQLLTESLVLGGLGAAAGVLLAALGLRGLVHLAPENIRAQGISIDPLVLAFAIGSALVAAMVFGMLPAVRATGGDVQKTLRDEGRGTTSLSSRRVRGSLAVLQLSLALALLLGATLLIKSFARVLQVNPGIQPDNLITLSMALPGARYQGEAMPRFYEDLVTRATALPGVRDAAAASIIPFSGGWDRITVDTGSTRNTVPNADLPEGDRYIVSNSYFQTMGIPLVAGREFTDADRFAAPRVAVVDEVFARKVERNGSALGFRIHVPGSDSMATIVGVVGHVKHYGLDAESGGQIYVSHVQYPWRWMALVARAEREPLALAPSLRHLVRTIDPNLAVTEVSTVAAFMSDRTAARRFVLALLAAFAAIALTLAAVGLYGVIAYTIAQRRREFGIRLALGATPQALVRTVMNEGAVLTGLGIALGIALAVAGTRLIGSLLFGVSPLDPAATLSAAAFLGAIAAVATWLPARRAATADPLESML